MSIQSASEFIINATHDQTLFDKLQEATSGKGDIPADQVSNIQYEMVSRLGQQEGYNFSPAEIKAAYESYFNQLKESEAEMADVELDLVAGGFKTSGKIQKFSPYIKPSIPNLPNNGIDASGGA